MCIIYLMYRIIKLSSSSEFDILILGEFFCLYEHMGNSIQNHLDFVNQTT